MVYPVQMGKLMAHHMRGPVLGHTSPYEPVQGHGCVPVKVSPGIIVSGFGNVRCPDLNQGLKNAFSHAVLQPCINRVGKVLFGSVHEGVNDPVGNLYLWKREGK